jgi:hypothetical protein
MNTRGLAKHYSVLTPRERLPLILAASVREDEVERERLARSAPRETYALPDYFWTAQTFSDLSSLHFLELLDLAISYHLALGLADTAGVEVGSVEVEEKAMNLAMYFAWKFRLLLAGWRTFCGELGMDAEACWAILPGYENFRKAERSTESAAFTPERIVAFLKRVGANDPVPPTAEYVAAELHRCFDARIAWWEDGGSVGPDSTRPGQ